MLRGYVLRASRDEVSGWIMDTEAPSEPLKLEVAIGSCTLGESTADLHRPDLAGIGAARHAFVFRFQPPIADEDVAKVKVLVSRPDGTRKEVARPPASRPGSGRAGLGDTGPGDTVQAIDLALAMPLAPPRAAPRPAAAVQPRFARCVLHIGMEKTGTTSLQRALALNRVALQAAGVFVPASLAPHAAGGYLNHIALMTHALDPGRLDEGLRVAAGVRDQAGVAAHRASVVDALRREVRAEAGSCRIMLLSNEHLQSRLRSADELETLRALVAGFADDVSVVLYLRPQHEVARAMFGSALKNGQTGIPLLPRLAGDGMVVPDMVDADYFRYDLLVQRWEAAFGRERLDVRLATEADLAGGDLVTDFFRRMKLDPDRLVRPAAKENTSFAPEATLVLQEANRLLATLPAEAAAAARERLVGTLQGTRPGRGITPTRKEAGAFLAAFADSNERVRAAWFPRRARLFEADFASYPLRRPAARLEPATLLAILVDVLHRPEAR